MGAAYLNLFFTDALVYVWFLNCGENVAVVSGRYIFRGILFPSRKRANGRKESRKWVDWVIPMGFPSIEVGNLVLFYLDMGHIQ